MLERDIESHSKAKAKNRGFWVRKFASPQQRSAPDDIFGKNGRAFFVEFKRTGQDPTPLQRIEHEKIRAAGLTVYVCDSRDGGGKHMSFTDILAREDPSYLRD